MSNASTGHDAGGPDLGGQDAGGVQRHAFQADIEAVARIDAVPTILDVICRATGMGFAAVARVTQDRWIVCQVLDNIGFGLPPGGELQVESTICDAIRQSRAPVIIDHVDEDAEYRDHPTPRLYQFQSYISMPILHRDGRFFGTLCAIDPRPARLNNPQTIGMFKLFAELIASHLDSDEQVQESAGALRSERHTARLREEFIAVLGHDLRNPLQAINSGLTLIGRTRLEEKAARVVPAMQASVMRMGGLIDDVLDFARGRMGDGLILSRTACDLEPVLSHVVTELRIGHPERVVDTDFTLDEPVSCDPARLSQLLSNLLANALTYGARDKPVLVHARAGGEDFTLSVSNQGEAISAEMLERLFEPFERGAERRSQQGLGLGLYIASEIAAAHGGALTATSTREETRFTFWMPLGQG